MSATVAVLLVVGLAVLFLRRAGELRRERLEVALEPTCLLCGAKDVVLASPPDYRCSCGFDTARVDGLTDELETFRALTWAVDELDLAADALVSQVLNREHGRAAGPFAMRTTRHVENALDYLRDVVLDQPTLAECPELIDDQESLDKLHAYSAEVQRVRRELRRKILIATTADGSPGQASTLRDFEHVIDQDYEDS